MQYWSPERYSCSDHMHPKRMVSYPSGKEFPFLTGCLGLNLVYVTFFSCVCKLSLGSHPWLGTKKMNKISYASEIRYRSFVVLVCVGSLLGPTLG